MCTFLRGVGGWVSRSWNIDSWIEGSGGVGYAIIPYEPTRLGDGGGGDDDHLFSKA